MGTGGEERAGETWDDLEVVRALRSRSFAPAWSVGRLPLRCPTTRRGGAISFWRQAGRPQVVVGSRLREQVKLSDIDTRFLLRAVVSQQSYTSSRWALVSARGTPLASSVDGGAGVGCACTALNGKPCSEHGSHA